MEMTGEERAARREVRKWLYRAYPELTHKVRKAIARGDVSLEDILELKAARPAEVEAF